MLDDNGISGWCQVYLLTADASRPLGAERLKYISSSLLSFLRDDARSGLRSVLGLSELHICIYGEHIGQQAMLHIQDADANVFAKLVLTPDEKNQWLLELSKHTRT